MKTNNAPARAYVSQSERYIYSTYIFSIFNSNKLICGDRFYSRLNIYKSPRMRNIICVFSVVFHRRPSLYTIHWLCGVALERHCHYTHLFVVDQHCKIESIKLHCAPQKALSVRKDKQIYLRSIPRRSAAFGACFALFFFGCSALPKRAIRYTLRAAHHGRDRRHICLSIGLFSKLRGHFTPVIADRFGKLVP